MKVVAVGIGHSIDEKELLEIASGAKDNVVKVDDFKGLFDNQNSVLKASCEIPVVPSGKPIAAVHHVQHHLT